MSHQVSLVVGYFCTDKYVRLTDLCYFENQMTLAKVLPPPPPFFHHEKDLPVKIRNFQPITKRNNALR